MSACITIPNGIVAGYFDGELQKANPKLRLNNVDPDKFEKNSKFIDLPDFDPNLPEDHPDQKEHWYPDGSWFEIDGSQSQLLNIKPVKRPLRRHFIKDFESNSFKILPKENGLTLRIEFETEGNEIKGWYHDALIKSNRDPGAADGNILAPKGSEYPFIEIDLNSFSVDGETIVINQPTEEDIRVGMRFDGNGILELFEGIIGSKIRGTIKNQFVASWDLFAGNLENKIRELLSPNINALGLNLDISQLSFDGDRVNICLGTADGVTDVAQIFSYFTHTLDSSAKDLFLIGPNPINGTGNELDNLLKGNNASNILIGLGGNDFLDGGEGNDELRGGVGNDLYRVQDVGDVVLEQENEGVDHVEALITYALENNVEELVLIGRNSIDGFGNSLSNQLTGNDASNYLDGQAGDDVIDGQKGDDILVGSAGNDTLIGGAGNDTADFTVSPGDVVASLAAHEAADGYGTIDIIRETENLIGSNFGDDTLAGDENDNFISGLDGNDEIDAGGGNDTAEGGLGNDIVYGGEGEDLLLGQAGDDHLMGEAGDDCLDGGPGSDTLDGGEGFDKATYADATGSVVVNQTTGLTGGAAAGDVLISIEGIGGSEFRDRIVGDELDNWLSGLGGNDSLDGRAGNDTIYGDAGDDDINGDEGDDVLNGGTGADFIYGGDGDDALNGDDDDDYLEGGMGDDTVLGGAGADILDSYTGDDRLEGGAGDDFAHGGAGNDTFVGGAGNDQLTGGGDRDRFIIRRGDGTTTITDFGGIGTGTNPGAVTLAEADVLQFEGEGLTARNMLLTQVGEDLVISFEGVADTTVVLQNFALEDLDNIGRGPGTTSEKGNVLFLPEISMPEADSNQFEDVFDIFNADWEKSRVFNRNTVTFLNDLNNETSGFDASDDLIYGLGGDDILNGLSGDDVLRGGEGNDVLLGGPGSDVLQGDAEADRFTFQTADQGLDTLTDFNAAAGDVIQIVAMGFDETLAVGVLAADHFALGIAQDESDRFLYDSSTGMLSFDADGIGAIAAVQIANIGAGNSLSHSHIVVV